MQLSVQACTQPCLQHEKPAAHTRQPTLLQWSSMGLAVLTCKHAALSSSMLPLQGPSEDAARQRGAGDWQHYQPPSAILNAVAQKRPPGPPK